MSDTLIVHMIGNAHLDPVWLWTWQRGADEALATCRAACDLLDDYPDAVFTRGEAWVYEQVRRLEPDTFERIRGHVAAGRWAVVNGWWVQPDVNLPTAEALLASARLGQAWFREHLGLPSVPVAYNVDSFGHGAWLPSLIRAAGQQFYVMMRPGQHEKALGSNLFRWRSPDGAEVPTFRIAGSYLEPRPQGLERQIHNALAAPRPAGATQVMCFYGVGNHGGGPTRRLVEWIRAHQDFAPGVKLIFSSPQQYFAAVADEIPDWPVVDGELQFHAIGCYSVCGGLKRELRAAELAVTDAERLLAQVGSPEEPALRAELADAWKTIAFNQFHDILAGSSILEATAAAQGQVAGARDRAEQVAYALTRRDLGLRHRPVDGHRLQVVNRAGRRWSGLADIEIPLDVGGGWNRHLADEDGQPLAQQLLFPASIMAENWGPPLPRILFPIDLEPGQARTLRIVDGLLDVPTAAPRASLDFGPHGLRQVTVDGEPLLERPLKLVALADSSDTWSHGIDRFYGPVHALGEFGEPVAVEHGPLRWTWRLDGTLGGSEARLYASVSAGSARVDLRLETNWRERLTLLKASVAPRGGIQQRRDRVAGGWHGRAVDGREYPLHHAALLNGELGVLFPDSFAADAAVTGALRVTLLRNSLHAYHANARLPMEDIPQLYDRFGTDEGPATLRLSLVPGVESEEALEGELAVLAQAPWVWDDYRGVDRLTRWE